LSLLRVESRPSIGVITFTCSDRAVVTECLTAFDRGDYLRRDLTCVADQPVERVMPEQPPCNLADVRPRLDQGEAA